jgi:pimeloyl-ACP methyl ester carboxylesterase
MKQIVKLIGFWLNSLAVFSKSYAGKKGMYIFCKPIRPKISAEQKAYLLKAEQYSLKIHNETVRYYKWGNGAKKVLFVHGWGSYAYRWKYFIDKLQNEDVTVYALDSIGHGLSTGNQVHVIKNAETIIACVEAIGGIDLIFAHSFGAFSTIFAFEKQPNIEIKECLILAAAENADSFFGFYKETLGLTDKTQQAIVDEFVSVLGNPPGYYKASNFAKKINRPCLVVHDKYDNETPYKGGVDIHEAWKNSTLITTENIGHQMKQARLSNYLIERIISSEPINKTNSQFVLND